MKTAEGLCKDSIGTSAQGDLTKLLWLLATYGRVPTKTPAPYPTPTSNLLKMPAL